MGSTWLLPHSSHWTKLGYLPIPRVPAVSLLQGVLRLKLCTCRSMRRTGIWPATHAASALYMWTILPSMKICSKIEPKIRVTVYELTFGHYIRTRKARPLSMNCGSASKVCHFLSSFPFDNRNKDNSLWIYCFWLLKTNGMFSNDWYWESNSIKVTGESKGSQTTIYSCCPHSVVQQFLLLPSLFFYVF